MRVQTQRLFRFLLLNAIVCLILPSGAWAAESPEEKWGALLGIGKFLNLLLVVLVLVWIARKPLAHFFANRSQSIRDQLDEAQKARREAEARLAEIKARMRNLDNELMDIKASAERDAREEFQRLVTAAERDSEKVVEHARREIEGMTRAAQIELRAHAAELSVRLAEEKIHREITDDDRSRLFSRFVARVGGRE